MNRDISALKIEILPEHIIDQIKAGEVLERPASLIKELIENSLDAKASEINIHLIENGMDLLSIEDNGHGINFNNLPYAFLRHATSKLKTFEDLYHLQSFGFRGEALASIAASSRLTCTSQPSDLSQDGGKLIIHGGAQEMLIPYRSASQGTSLFIKDLFYNTPARLKFVKSKISEKSALKKMLYSFVLCNHKVNFSIKWDEKEREIFKAVTDQEVQKRVEQVFFSQISKNTLKENLVLRAYEEYENYKVEVFFTPETYSTPQYRHHYLFANNRYFQDRSIHQALLRSLDNVWCHGESGHYIVKMTIPSEDMDVNVHPNKTQLKFLKSDTIYSLLVSGIRSAIKNTSLNNFSLESTPLVADSFYSREENQNLDLINMQSIDNQNQFRSAPTQTSSILNSDSTANLDSILIGYIGKNTLLLKIENIFYITDHKKLIASYISHVLNEQTANEEIASPLLISEPFKITRGKIDDHLDDLKSLGLELDRLNNDVIALRTMPRSLPQVLLRETVENLLNYFSQNKTNQFSPDDFALYYEEHFSPHLQVAPHVINNILEKKITKISQVLVELNEKNLKTLLK